MPNNRYNFHNKTFLLLQNSDEGEVDKNTIFKYKQDNDLVTADYFGGTIRYGKIIARLSGDKLDMVYQCLTTDNELKSGKSTAKISLEKSGKIKLRLDWEWLTNGHQKGSSDYLEID